MTPKKGYDNKKYADNFDSIFCKNKTKNLKDKKTDE